MTFSLILSIVLYLLGIMLILKSTPKTLEFRVALAIFWPVVVIVSLLK